MRHIRRIRIAMSRPSAAPLLIAPLALVGALALGSTAQAQAPDTAASAGNVVVQCSEIFGPGAQGTVVFTPSGNFNANCNPFAPSPAGAGGAIVAKCADVFGEEFRGNIVQQPNGHFKGHCR